MCKWRRNNLCSFVASCNESSREQLPQGPRDFTKKVPLFRNEFCTSKILGTTTPHTTPRLVCYAHRNSPQTFRKLAFAHRIMPWPVPHQDRSCIFLGVLYITALFVWFITAVALSHVDPLTVQLWKNRKIWSSCDWGNFERTKISILQKFVGFLAPPAHTHRSSFHLLPYSRALKNTKNPFRPRYCSVWVYVCDVALACSTRTRPSPAPLCSRHLFAKDCYSRIGFKKLPIFFVAHTSRSRISFLRAHIPQRFQRILNKVVALAVWSCTGIPFFAAAPFFVSRVFFP